MQGGSQRLQLTEPCAIGPAARAGPGHLEPVVLDAGDQIVRALEQRLEAVEVDLPRLDLARQHRGQSVKLLDLAHARGNRLTDRHVIQHFAPQPVATLVEPSTKRRICRSIRAHSCLTV
jgi:hypothetical protein